MNPTVVKAKAHIALQEVSGTVTAVLGHGPGGTFSSAGLGREDKGDKPYPFSKIARKPGDKYRSLKRPRAYEALLKQGYSKEEAARISNAMASKGEIAQEAANIKAEALVKLMGVSKKDITEKAVAQNARALLEAKIHRAYTTVADDLYGRGYVDRDTRLAIGQKLGKLLTKFGTEVSDDLGLEAVIVDADDVHHIAKVKEAARAKTRGETPAILAANARIMLAAGRSGSKPHAEMSGRNLPLDVRNLLANANQRSYE